MEFFNQDTFTVFLMLLSIVYVLVSLWMQKKFGKSDRLAEIQKELNAISKQVGEASKKKDNAAVEELMKKQSPLLSELMSLQMRLMPITLGLFVVVAFLLSAIEPYAGDDFKVPLYDDGLLSHCDAVAGDLIYSNCYALNATAHKGAWVVSAEAFNGESQVAQNATAFYVEKGKPEDVYLQAKQHGLLEILTGAKLISISPFTGKANYTLGETVSLHANVSEKVDTVVASMNNGTFYFVDLPIPLPLLNIKRLVGAIGFFILCSFIFSILISFLKGILNKMNVHIPFVTDKPTEQKQASQEKPAEERA